MSSNVIVQKVCGQSPAFKREELEVRDQS